MGSSVAARRHAWLRGSCFSPDVQATLLDLPFDAARLFGAPADCMLQRFKDSKVTARSFGFSHSLRMIDSSAGFGALEGTCPFEEEIGNSKAQIPFIAATREGAEVVSIILSINQSLPPLLPPLPRLQVSSSSFTILELACPVVGRMAYFLPHWTSLSTDL